MSALDAARAAAADEATRKKAAPPRKKAKPAAAPAAVAPVKAAPAPTSFSPAKAAQCIIDGFPRVEVTVMDVRAVNQTEVLKALWNSHRARFLAEGDLTMAGGAAAVLSWIQSDPGSIAAVHIRVGSSEACAWVHLGHASVIAAFPEAQTYLAGTG